MSGRNHLGCNKMLASGGDVLFAALFFVFLSVHQGYLMGDLHHCCQLSCHHWCSLSGADIANYCDNKNILSLLVKLVCLLLLSSEFHSPAGSEQFISGHLVAQVQIWRRFSYTDDRLRVCAVPLAFGSLSDEVALFFLEICHPKY